MIDDYAEATKIVKDFAHEHCVIDESVMATLERNYNNCYALAEQWASALADWRDPAKENAAITDMTTALTATRVVVDLIRVGNETRSEYYRVAEDPGKPSFGTLSKVVKDEYYAGRKIGAIKKCRELTHCGLKEAKDFVEALMINHETVREII